MEINAKQADSKYYVTHLQRADDSLMWDDLGNNSHTLFLRGPFGVPLELEGDLLDRFVEDCRDMQFWQSLISGMETTVTDGVTAVTVPHDAVNIRSYHIPVVHSTYAAYAFNVRQDAADLYLPNKYYTYQCEVPAVANVRISPRTVTVTTGHFFNRKTETRTVGYDVNIQPIAGYDGTGLVYTFEGCPFQYPITRELLGKSFTVPICNAPDGSQMPLVVKPTDGGYEIHGN